MMNYLKSRTVFLTFRIIVLYVLLYCVSVFVCELDGKGIEIVKMSSKRVYILYVENKLFSTERC